MRKLYFVAGALFFLIAAGPYVLYHSLDDYYHLSLDLPRLNQANRAYLLSHVATRSATGSPTGRSFCASEILGMKKDVDRIQQYLWVVCEELVLRDGKFISDSGISAPFVLVTTEEPGGYRILEHHVPRDGETYVADVKALFPWWVWRRQLLGLSGESQALRTRQLQEALVTEARDYFHAPSAMRAER